MEQVQGYIDDFIYGFLKPKLEDAILNVLGNYENESRTLAQSIANNTLSDFDEGSIINLFDEIDSKVSTQADTDLSILGGMNLYNSLEEHVPVNRIKNLVNSLRPITNVINKFGPILDILQFAAGGVTSIITKIVIEIVEDFLNILQPSFNFCVSVLFMEGGLNIQYKEYGTLDVILD